MGEARFKRKKRGKWLLLAAAVAGVGVAAWYAKGRGDGEPTAPEAAAAAPVEARSLHQAVLVLDGHVDVLLPETPRRYHLPDGGSRASLEQLEQGGVDALVLSIAVGPGPESAEGAAAARQVATDKLAAVARFIADSQGRVELARSADDIERLRQAGKVAVLLGFQNARILDGDLAAFDPYYEAGVRVAGLAHAGHNAFADSSRPSDPSEPERHHGLSPLGRDAVRRFNDLGVVVDVSQLSTSALLQTLELSKAPVVASHSDARALVDNVRNLSDAELDAIKANGGVVQLTPFTSYLRLPDEEELAGVGRLRAEYGLSEAFVSPSEGYTGLPAEKGQAFYDALVGLRRKATLEGFVDHIDYVAKRIGVDHVGIGSDFNHGAGVEGFDGERDAPNVTAELLRRGYTPEQVAGIWGGNFLRVLRQVEAGRKT